MTNSSPAKRSFSAATAAARSVYFNEHHAALRLQVREALHAHVKPFAEAWEDARYVPQDGWRELGRLGLLGLNHKRIHGGTEQDIFSSVVFLEELGRLGYGGIRAAISVHAYMATHYLAKHASAPLQESYLTPAIRGESVAALAITEWEAGSDLSRLSTRALAQGNHFLVTGTKTFITNGFNADFFVVAVRTQPVEEGRPGNTGISLLLVERKSPGITVHSQEKLGWHAAGTAEIRFDGVEVPAANLIGRLNSGFSYLMRGFQLERLVAAVLALGGVDYCIDSTLGHITSRKAFGGSLSQLQTIRHRMARLASDLAAARMLTYHAAWAYAGDELAVQACSMAKLQATDLACRAAEECLQLQGATGYLAESDIARVHRDARAGAMAGGATEIMSDIVAQQLIEMRTAI